MDLILITRYLLIVFSLIILSIIELLVVQAATINIDRLYDVMDKDGMIPIPNLLVKYNIKDYYDTYTSSANLLAKLLNLVFVIITIKILFFEDIERYCNVSDKGLAIMIFILLSLICIIACLKVLRVLVLIKNRGFKIAKENSKNFDNTIINTYLCIILKISKTDDNRIANNRLWLQFFINKFFTVISITILFYIKIVVEKFLTM